MTVELGDGGSVGISDAGDLESASGVALSAGGVVVVTVSAVNDAPEVAVVTPAPGVVGSTVACEEDGRSAVGAIGVDVTDATDGRAGTAVLEVTVAVAEAGAPGTEGVVQVGDAGTPAAWSSGAHAGYDLVAGLNAAGACGAGATAADGCVVVTGDGTRAVTLLGREGPLSVVLDALVFAGAGDFYGDSVVSVSVSDLGNEGAGNVLGSGAALVTVRVSPVNDSPTVSIGAVGGAAGWRVAEDGETVAGELVVASGDAADGRPGDVLTYTVAVLGGGAGAMPVLTLETGAGSAAGALIQGGGVVVVSGGDGMSGAAEFRCASGDAAVVFAAVTVAPAADWYGDLTVSVTVDDGGQFGSGSAATTAGASIGLEVVGVNDAPVLEVAAGSAAVTIAEDGETAVGAVAFAAGAGDSADGVPGAVLTLAFAASDGAVVVLSPGSATSVTGTPAGGGSALSVSALVAGGFIAVSGGAGGTGSVTLEVESGLVAAAVSMVQIVPAGDYYGEVTVTVELGDGGSVGISDAGDLESASGVALSAGGVVVVTVSAVNDAPEVAVVTPAPGVVGSTVACEEDGRSAVGAIGVDVTDATDGRAGTAVLEVTVAVAEAGAPGTEGVVQVGDAGTPAAWSSGAHAGYDLVAGLNAAGACGAGATAADGCVVVTGDGTRAVTLLGREGPLSVVLDALVFAGAGDFYGDSVVSVSVSDLGNEGAGNVLGSGAALVTVRVSPVNDSPTVSIGAVGGAAGWRVAEDGETVAGELVVASGDAADGRPGDVLTYTVAVLGGGAGAMPVLTLETGAGSAAGALIQGGGVVVVSGGDGMSGAAEFRCASGDAAVVFAAVTVAPAADWYGDLTVSVTVDDGGQFGSGSAATTAGASIGLEVVGVNDAPVLEVAAGSAAVTIAEDGETAVGAVAFAAGAGDSADGVPGAVLTLAFAASDGAVVVLSPGSATSVTGTPAGGGSALSVSALVAGGFIAVSGGAGGTGSVTLEVESGLVAAAVSMVQIVPAGDYYGEVTVTVELGDGGSVGISDAGDLESASGVALSAGGVVVVTVSAVNDAPEVAVVTPAPGVVGSTVACEEDGRSAVGAIGVDVTDATDGRAGTAVLEVTVAVAEAGAPGTEGVVQVGDAGTPAAWSSGAHAGYDLVAGLNAAGACGAGATAADGCVVVTGDGTRAVTLLGREGPLSVVLDALVFAGAGDFYGDSVVSVSVSDLGNEGAGNVLGSGAALVTVRVSPVNDSPTVSIGAVGGAAGWRVAEDGETVAGELVVASGDAADGRPGDVLTYTVAVLGGGAGAMPVLALETGAGSAAGALIQGGGGGGGVGRGRHVGGGGVPVRERGRGGRVRGGDGCAGGGLVRGPYGERDGGRRRAVWERQCGDDGGGFDRAGGCGGERRAGAGGCGGERCGDDCGGRGDCGGGGCVRGGRRGQRGRGARGGADAGVCGVGRGGCGAVAGERDERDGDACRGRECAERVCAGGGGLHCGVRGRGGDGERDAGGGERSGCGGGEHGADCAGRGLLRGGDGDGGAGGRGERGDQ